MWEAKTSDKKVHGLRSRIKWSQKTACPERAFFASRGEDRSQKTEEEREKTDWAGVDYLSGRLSCGQK